jgi:hypothetical protein
VSEARLKFRYLSGLRVWKRESRHFRDSGSLHTRMGIRAKSLKAHQFPARTYVGAKSGATGRLRLFLMVSAGILTGFSAAPSEN